MILLNNFQNYHRQLNGAVIHITSPFTCFVIFILFCISIISCDKGVHKGNNEFNLQIVDSIYVNGVYDLEFIDTDSEYSSMLFYSLAEKKIFSVDRESKKILDIPFPGQSTSVAGYSFKSGKYHYTNSGNSIIIWTDFGYHFYDTAGNLYRNEKFKTVRYHPKGVSFFEMVEIDSQSVAVQSNGGTYSRDGRFSRENSNLIQTYNFSDKTSNLYKGFMIDDPILDKNTSFKLRTLASFEGNNYFHIMFSPDNAISTFSIQEKFQFVSNERIDIPGYKNVLPRNTPQDYIINSDIYSLFSDTQNFFIVYKPYINPEKIDISFSEGGVLSPISAESVSYYLYLHNRTTGKGYSVELPKNLPGFQAKLEENLFLVQPSAYYVEHAPGNIFYIVSLNQNK